MRGLASSGSIFSQKLDRIVFVAYFLGAIVPLVALAVVVERFALPLLNDRLSSLGLIAAVLSIGVLSLSSFLILRRTTRQTIERMDRDNSRLSSLLGVSSALAAAHHGTDAASTAARCALELSGARATFVVGRGGGDRPLVLASAGSDAEKLAETLAGPVFELAELALSEGRPVLREPDRGAGAGGPQPGAAVAVPLPGESEPLGALVAIQVGDRARFDAPQVDALSTLAALAAVALRNADLRDAQRNFFAHMTDLLVTALDSHLGYNRDHGRHVAENANRLGRALGLDEKQLHRLHFAALLHDIGMLKFERKQHHNSKACAKHCTIGARMLATIRLWEELAPIVRHHHEWYDGRGYPDGLAGDSIPLEARLIAVCDAFDAMVSPTSYKMPMTVAEATRELRECAGSQFDPQVVEPFLELIEQGVVAPPG